MGFWNELWTDDWWLQYGLDGIGGGLLAGGIAAWAVRRTIKHERSERAKEAAEAQHDRLAEALSRALVAATSMDLPATMNFDQGAVDAQRRSVDKFAAELALSLAISRTIRSDIRQELLHLQAELVAIPNVRLRLVRALVPYRAAAAERLTELLEAVATREPIMLTTDETEGREEPQP